MKEQLRWRIVLREGDKANLLLECSRGCKRKDSQVRECAISLWRRPAIHPMWNWDGNMTHPTISPSIDCKGGCNRHFTMISGVPQG